MSAVKRLADLWYDNPDFKQIYEQGYVECIDRLEELFDGVVEELREAKLPTEQVGDTEEF